MSTESSTVAVAEVDAVAHAPASSRLLSLDALRGLIMVLMAIDHASIFIARQHAGEYWGTALPQYPDALTMLTRNLTHLCAPGFFLLMGAGMVFFTASRSAAGWSDGRIAGFFVKRGLLLVALQFLVENPAWLLGTSIATPGAAIEWGGGVPGGGSEVLLYFGVLYGLGCSMILLGLLMRAPTALFAVISAGAVAGTALLVPSASQASHLPSLLTVLLVVPSHADAVQVSYPLVPWLAASAAGVVLGRAMLADRERTLRTMLPLGALGLVSFVALRLLGAGDFHPVGPGWMGFLTVTKYPPSLAFLALELGIDVLLLWLLWRMPARVLSGAGRPLLVFGRTALFFYVVHLYLYALIGAFFPSGTSIAAMYPLWLLGLVLLFGACSRYDDFRRSKPVDSVWRFF